MILSQTFLTLKWNTCSKSAVPTHGKFGIELLQRRTTFHLRWHKRFKGISEAPSPGVRGTLF